MTIVDSADAIGNAVAAIRFVDYCKSRLIRAAVEREFITIGEALRVISQMAPDLFEHILEGRQIIDFRNLLTHESPNISDRIVWGAIESDLPLLIQHCAQELQTRIQESS